MFENKFITGGERIEFVLLVKAILSLFQFIFLLLVISPVLFFRWILGNCACCFNYYQILGKISSVYTTDNIEEGSRNNVIFSVTTQGKLNLHDINLRLKNEIFKTIENGDLQYPQFQMFWIKRFGFPFWKKDKIFQIENHLYHQIIPKDCNDEDSFILTFEQNMLSKGFRSHVSPWEVALLEKEDEYWIFFFKYHHSLADGHSLFKVLTNLADDLPPLYEPSFSSNSSMIKTILNFLTYPFIGAYEWTKLSVESALPNPWTLPVDKMSNNERIMAMSNRISSSEMTKVRKSHLTSYTATLLAIITGAIHNVFQKQGKPLPKYIVSRMPIPKPNRPSSGLSNHFTGIFFKLPVSISSGKDRLKFCENELDIAKTSRNTITATLLDSLFGSLPDWLQEIVLPKIFQSIQIGNFPGPREFLTFHGHPVIDMHFNVLWTKRNPMYLLILSYNGGFRIVANADPALFPTKSLLQEFVLDIEEELRKLAVA